MVTPGEIFSTIVAVLATSILVYVARLPAKGRYYLPFMLYCTTSLAYALVTIVENSGLTLEQAFQVSKLVDVAVIGLFTLQYHFILNFAKDKKNRFQKITLAGQYVYWAVLGTTYVLGLEWTKSAGYGSFTATGYSQPSPNAPWHKYLSTPTIPVINHQFTYDYVIITLLSLYTLLSYSRSSKFPLVKSQVRYLCAGVLLDYTAAVYHGFVTQHGSPLYGAPAQIQNLIYCATLSVLLIGLTRHQFRKVIPAVETAAAIPQTYELKEGRSYLSRENDSSFAAFSELVRNGREGLCIARIFPDDVRKTYGLQTTPIRWLSEEKREDAISATDLLGISITLKDFMERAKRPVVMLQGIEYLARVNGFDPVIRLLDGLYETAGRKNAIILIPVSPNALEPREDAILVAETTPIPTPTRS